METCNVTPQKKSQQNRMYRFRIIVTKSLLHMSMSTCTLYINRPTIFKQKQ